MRTDKDISYILLTNMNSFLHTPGPRYESWLSKFHEPGTLLFIYFLFSVPCPLSFIFLPCPPDWRAEWMVAVGSSCKMDDKEPVPVFMTKLGVKSFFGKGISTQNKWGPHFPPAHAWQVCSSANQQEHNNFSTGVCKVTFKHLSQPLRSYHSAGEGGILKKCWG